MKKRMLFLIGAAAAGAYGIIKGKGPFNKLRFKSQHDSISRYVETHYPDSLYSPIEATEKGWVTIIRRRGKPQVMLYISRDMDGNYIFTEAPVVNS